MILRNEDRISIENEWVKGINEGSHKAFEAVYKSYYPGLGQFLLRYVRSERVAEDIIHNVFYEIWNNRRRLEPKGTLRAYLYTAVRNQALKHLAKEKKSGTTSIENHPGLMEVSGSSVSDVELAEFDREVKHAVMQLPEKRRMIFLMHREDEMTYREIAEALDISIKTVETQMSRSLKFLAEKLSHLR